MLTKTVWIHSILQAHQGTLIHVSSSLHHLCATPQCWLTATAGCHFQTPQPRGKKTTNPKPMTTTPQLFWVAFTVLDCKERHVFLLQQH